MPPCMRHLYYRVNMIAGRQVSICRTRVWQVYNSPYLRWTHHWMFDADFYPIEAIKLMRQCMARNEGNPAPGSDDRSRRQSCSDTEAERLGEKGVG
jgi:hypothetical protein